MERMRLGVNVSELAEQLGVERTTFVRGTTNTSLNSFRLCEYAGV